ncbi:MAG: AAA family ATPase [Prevotellaceae bacterium]|nr:AAA family ATPase [Candidatus Colivivens equi]
MKVTIENLGIIKYAEYELGELTIICGANNMGKTYATYSLYGFIDFFNNGYMPKIDHSIVSKLINEGACSIPIQTDQEYVNKMVDDACKEYKPYLPMIFNAQDKYFSETRFSVHINSDEVVLPQKLEKSYKRGNKEFVAISLSDDKSALQFSLLSGDLDASNQSLRISVSNIIGDSIKQVLFSHIFPDCFIASAERTGAVIFKDELNIQKFHLLREIAASDNLDISSILNKVYSTPYPLPVRRNIDFIRNLENVSKREGILYKQKPEIVEMYNRIIGGKYDVSKEGIRYCPNNSKGVKLQIVESASSIRSLLDVFFYLKHAAKPGDMLLIDEPELNLHPKSQRDVARLLASLVNSGIKVFITTHSDYIIKELNTLLMLKSRAANENVAKLMTEKGYHNFELLDSDQVKVYMAMKDHIKLEGKTRKSLHNTLVKAHVDNIIGISAETFNDTINEINEIQEHIYFS